MKGDNCSRIKHSDRIAIGYIEGSNYGLDACKECYDNHNGKKTTY